MGEIYKNPLRIYLILTLLALWGVIAGFSLPISLFPNSSRPTVQVNVPYGGLAADNYYKTYGKNIESQLQGLIIDNKPVAELTADYSKYSVQYRIKFAWGVEGKKALSEVQNAVAGLAASWPEESRRSYNVYTWRENGGFLALSFYSTTRSLDDLYDLLQPLFLPLASQVPDADGIGLYNPKKKQIEITLDPERMALLQVTVSAVESAIRSAGVSLGGGKLNVGDNKFAIEMPRVSQDLESIKNLSLYSMHGNLLQLRDIADVQIKTDLNSSRIFKTSGVPSLILFANPKSGSNIKKMSEDILKSVNAVTKNLPKDIQYKILVNPAEFINSSVHSVMKEVAVAALLAVIILLIFIGSFKNVITAAIEIPLSIVMAFIFMKLFNMNLNLISLGGLALSAGMNVDASVVVMENIFRKFDIATGEMTPARRLQIVIEAVREVMLPVIASTIASLVVFIPLILTDGLTNSILGDLAKAVVFSHSMSAVVALILVPTVRLQMMNSEKSFHLSSPIEKQFLWLENFYAKTLKKLMQSKRAQISLYTSLFISFILLIFFVLPKLNVEIVGRPETDWVILGFNSSSLSTPRQVDSYAEKLEYDVMQDLGDKVAYTFTQINGTNNAMIMIRLKNRKNMDSVWKLIEDKYVNTPTVNFWSEPWNPSELPIPDPDHFRVEVRGGSPEERRSATQEFTTALNESKIFPRVWARPNSSHVEEISLTPYPDVLKSLNQGFDIYELANYVRVATEGKEIGELSIDQKTYPIELNMIENRVNNLETLKSLPIGTGDKIIPLNALSGIQMRLQEPSLYRVNQADVSIISARTNESEKSLAKEKRVQAEKVLTHWLKEHKNLKVSVASVEADQEIQDALKQLKWALLLSVLLIFVTMVIQFGDLIHAALVMVAVPLGFIGVLISLFVFHSTLSLNSALGTILLSGIAVANSIILVDFMKKLVDSGVEPFRAAIDASRARLRPILMTSLTTVLGMMPIALGLGEGGRILQPLGIAVAGGLWISMLLTIFIVPTLQATYLLRKSNKRKSVHINKVEWANRTLDL